jgi:hypothetical protein
MTLKFGFFSDLTRDGAIDMNDAVVWTRQQYPRADWLMRAGLMTKIQNDMTSYTSGGCNGTGNSQSRVTFNKTIDAVKWLADWTDNATVIWHMVGWQGSGHDTLYPSLNVINPNVGTRTDLDRLAKETKKYNSLISYHINTDEAYQNFSATQGCDLLDHPVSGLQVQPVQAVL